MRKNFLAVCFAVFSLITACFNTTSAQSTQNAENEPNVSPVIEDKETAYPNDTYRYLTGEGVTMIGDSIMNGSRDVILEQLPDALIDAKGSRDICGGFEAARRLEQQGTLSDVVIVELGTNGPLLNHEPYASGTQNILQLLGTDRQIFWVTTYCSYSQWMNMNNAFIWELSKTRPNIKVIDWYSLAIEHPEWFPDGVHPNLTGAREFAKMLKRALEEFYAPQQTAY